MKSLFFIYLSFLSFLYAQENDIHTFLSEITKNKNIVFQKKRQIHFHQSNTNLSFKFKFGKKKYRLMEYGLYNFCSNGIIEDKNYFDKNDSILYLNNSDCGNMAFGFITNDYFCYQVDFSFYGDKYSYITFNQNNQFNQFEALIFNKKMNYKHVYHCYQLINASYNLYLCDINDDKKIDILQVGNFDPEKYPQINYDKTRLYKEIVCYTYGNSNIEQQVISPDLDSKPVVFGIFLNNNCKILKDKNSKEYYIILEIQKNNFKIIDYNWIKPL